MKNLKSYSGLLLLIISLNLNAQESFRVERTGNGEPILLFPGFACTSEVFNGIIDTLSEDYEVHAFTFAGFGGVPPIEFPWLPQIKKDIEKYVIDNNLKKPIIIGHSLGGTLGLWLASEDPDYSKVIIIDALPAMGALMMPDFNGENIVYESPYNQQLLDMNREDFRKMAQQMTAGMSGNAEKNNQLTAWMVQSDRKTYVYGYTDLLKLDLRHAIENIKSPVTILAATEPYGKETAELNYTEQYENLKNYTLKFADGASHFVMYDKPEWFLDQIYATLDGNE